jgi:hypothetical protein
MNTTDNNDFYNNRKHCDSCNKYVSYLMSVDTSYCVECGSEVHLFSSSDWTALNESIDSRRPKSGRPRKTAPKTVAA